MSRIEHPLFLVAVPPMTTAFFHGAVGRLMAYSAFWQGQAMRATRSGSGYVPAACGESSDPTSAVTHSHRGNLA